MELKDMILSTLAELEEPIKEEVQVTQIKETLLKATFEEEIKETPPKAPPVILHEEEYANKNDERQFCESLRERVLVLFEGFQSPNNKNIEAKIDLTLNFLEYLLAVADERLEILDSQKK